MQGLFGTLIIVFFPTRRISVSAFNGFSRCSSTLLHSTRSKVFFSKGRLCASPGTKFGILSGSIEPL